VQGLSFQVQQPAPSQIAPANQSVHILVVNCEAEFAEAPLVTISFSVGGVARRLTLRLPVTVARFVTPVQINSQDFFSRWKQIGNESGRETFKDFKSGPSVNPEFVKQVLTAFQLSILDGIDPNPSNFVSAGIFTSGNGTKAGVLIRVQLNPAADLTRVSVRSTSASVTASLANYLALRLSSA